ncbi:MAG: hypothetical protein NZX77_20530, partial [Polyangiaceae bacterium]|nr:hypothetical protein [Polyangiaceae bacterium]
PNNPPRDRNNPEAYLLRAVIYKEQNRRSLAVSSFERAIALRPDLVDARIQLAAYLLESGNATAAKPLLDDALKYSKDNLIAHLNRGDALRLLGDVAGAKSEFEWVVSKDPNLPQVHYSLGLLYLFSESVPGMSTKKQQYEAAIAELQRFQQLRGKPSSSTADDSDQLIARANTNLEAIKGQEQAAAAAAAASASATAAASVSAAPPSSSSSGALPAGSAPSPTDAPPSTPLRNAIPNLHSRTLLSPLQVPAMNFRSLPLLPVVLLLLIPGRALAQKKGKTTDLGEITIVGRVQKPVAAVDITRLAPKLTLAELRQPFLDRIEQVILNDPF